MSAGKIELRTRTLSSVLIAALVSCIALPGGAAQTNTAAQTPASPRHASVHFENGLLTVTASNASLNAILHEVAHTTGMKITGSVPEDRVFGTYGPESPERVLTTLLDGTGTNILILSNQANQPLQLVLTRRSGGITPPDPTAAQDVPEDEDADDVAPARSVSPTQAVPVNRSHRSQQSTTRTPPGNPPSEVTQPVVFAPIGATTPASTATTTPVNPDDANDPGTESVKTPEQIFEQLQRLQQGTTPAPNSAQPPQ